MSVCIKSFFDPATWTFTYAVYDREGGHAAIIDPVLDYDPKAARTSTASADLVADYVQEKHLQLEWILETHAHADHVSAAHYLQGRLGGKLGIGDHITQVQSTFAKIFNLEPEFRADGSQFQMLLSEGATLAVGDLSLEVLFVPGHTAACVAYKIEDAIFVGDTLFPPDVGTARCDFPGGDARTLYHSVRRLLEYPAKTRLFMCHDYPPEGRTPRAEISVAEQRDKNIHVHDGVSEEAFVALREARDRTLAKPVLILPAIQLNIRAGELPPPEANGVAYLKLPLNLI
ncbi:MAG: MBL fold metallo-hydrolase [Gammaproteobacteria bacterium]|nr:MBL fold metallo-hydrolase [Gammaproteobacteria bacterium]